MAVKISQNGKASGLNNGFTIVETLIVIFVFVLVLGAFVTLYIWHGGIYNYQQASVRVADSGRQSMQSMQVYGNQAYRVLGSLNLGGTAYTSGEHSLVLQVPSINSSGDPVAGKWDYAVYYLDGSKLMHKLSADPASSRPSVTKQLSDTVNTLEFEYDSEDFPEVQKVTVELRTQLGVKGQNIANILQKDIILRNYH